MCIILYLLHILQLPGEGGEHLQNHRHRNLKASEEHIQTHADSCFVFRHRVICVRRAFLG